MNLSRWLNLALAVIVSFILYHRLPGIIHQFRVEGDPLPAFTVPLLDGRTYESLTDREARVIVFWATWCGPCGVELRRIQRSIDSGDLDKETVIAISSFEEVERLRGEVANRQYTFQVGVDLDGAVAHRLGISATPTVIFKSRDNHMEWVSSGISPTLIWRMSRLLQRENPR